MLAIFVIILTILLVFVCLLICLVVLMQRPKQEGLGAAFGGALTDRVLGSGTTDFLQKATVYLGVMFFIFSLGIATLTAKIQNVDRQAQIPEVEESAAVEEEPPMDDLVPDAPPMLEDVPEAPLPQPPLPGDQEPLDLEDGDQAPDLDESPTETGAPMLPETEEPAADAPAPAEGEPSEAEEPAVEEESAPAGDGDA